jgi:hypothetical protein
MRCVSLYCDLELSQHGSTKFADSRQAILWRNYNSAEIGTDPSRKGWNRSGHTCRETRGKASDFASYSAANPEVKNNGRLDKESTCSGRADR